eukprot:TRINITY_DN556_c1_g1_i1.p1 TRINITY_DN556_c1_g1~~TRINITY_DN556_c1_g1_i1.p1  ORF type:complete len:1777 (-),score=529.48 TRINITY_DN556_c1_g1_i1:1681-6783(-)
MTAALLLNQTVTGELATTTVPPLIAFTFPGGRRPTNTSAPLPLATMKRLYYTPDNDPQVTQIMYSVGLPPSLLVGFPSFDAMQESFVLNHTTVLGGVSFFSNFTADGLAGTPQMYRYSIHMDSKNVPDTKKKEGQSIEVIPVGARLYLFSGFAALQIALDKAILSYHAQTTNGTAINQINATVRLLPLIAQNLWQRFHFIDIQNILSFMAGVYMTLALFISCFRLLTEMVYEKERRIREAMRMMGLKMGTGALANICTVLIVATLPIIIICLVLCYVGLYHYSSAAYVMLLYFSTLISFISLSYLISIFMNKAKFAGIFGLLFTAAGGVIGVVLSVRKAGRVPRLVLSLWSSAAFALVGTNIATLEVQNLGATYDTMTVQPDDLSPSNAALIGMIWFDAVWYMVLAWYLDQVMPGEFGTSRGALFFLKRSYWRNVLQGEENEDEIASKGVEMNEMYDMSKFRADIEQVPDAMRSRCAVLVRDLKKSFKSGQRPAVDGLNMDMYYGQITSFLGHNGAGKTTTISMLTGLIPPSGGDAWIAGHNIRTNMPLVRQSLGVCPQQDVIWEDLSVAEHLRLYAALKGVPMHNIQATVDAMLIDIGLDFKRNANAGSLSGGQKRKLCLAIAFIGGSKVLFLDEPTSGMDPVTRRSVWDFLLRNKAGRAIILTTHFMDEADYLGDRIAIIAHGNLRCAGTSLFLKSRFGVGYVLTLVKAPGCVTEGVSRLVVSHVPGAILTSDVGAELSYRLPRNEERYFGQLLRDLDANLETLQVQSYGLGLGTLEAVFLEIGAESLTERQRALLMGTSAPKADDTTISTDMTGKTQDLETSSLSPAAAAKTALQYTSTGQHSGQQLAALLIKRAQVSRVDKKSIAFSFFLPLILVLATLVVIYLEGDGRFTTVPGTVVTSNGFVDMYGVPVQRPGPALNMNLPNLLATNTAWGIYNRVLYSGDANGDLGTPLSYVADQSEFVALGNEDVDQAVLNRVANPLTNTYAAAGAYSTSGFSGNNIDYTVLLNANLFHGLPGLMHSLHDGLMREATLGAMGIEMQSQPFPHVATQSEALFNQLFVQSRVNAKVVQYTTLVMQAAYGMIPAGFIASLVLEREMRVKSLLLVSGLSTRIYWLSIFLWDTAAGMLVVFFNLILWAACFRDDVTSGIAGQLLLLLTLFVLAVNPMSYVLTSRLKSHTLAIGIVFLLQFGVGVILTTGWQVPAVDAVIHPEDEANAKLTDALFYLFSIVSPVFALGNGILQIFGFPVPHMSEDVWSARYRLGWVLIILALQTLFWWSVLLLSEYASAVGAFLRGVFRMKPKSYKLSDAQLNIPEADDAEKKALIDSDVLAERTRVEGRATYNPVDGSGDIIRAAALRKVYPKGMVAVNHVSLGIPRSECFGLLGMNGAGKSTTLGMLSGNIEPTSGEVNLNGFDLISQRNDALRYFGWCPQFDALIPQLTGRQQLALYARIKGLPSDVIRSTVDSFLYMLDLEAIADRPVGGYSGGNKRKISLAVAMIGSPPIVFLDEPSTGMDPLSRRLMWNVVTALMAGKAVILTTHSMEECEALCSRLAIMSKGRLTCIGSAQHLKNKFASGYLIQVKPRIGSTMETVARFEQAFPFAVLAGNVRGAAGAETAQSGLSGSGETVITVQPPPGVEVDGTELLLAYEMPQETTRDLSGVFGVLQEMSANGLVEDYSVAQPTVEQIFLKLAEEKES